VPAFAVPEAEMFARMQRAAAVAQEAPQGLAMNAGA
jgi:hypothetical protein